jgi:hypothetical protein
MNKGPLFKKFDKIVTRHGDIGFIVDVQPLTVFNTYRYFLKLNDGEFKIVYEPDLLKQDSK